MRPGRSRHRRGRTSDREEDSPCPTSSDEVAGLACRQRADCATGAEVVSCARDGGHDWPRRGEDPFVLDVIWEPFEKNGR